MAFHVGQLVEYVGGKHGPVTKFVDTTGLTYARPVLGRIYTVRSVNCWPGGTLLLLAECDNSGLAGIPGSVIEPGFNAKYFRPLTESRLAIFRDLLAPVPTKERERA